MGQMKMVIEIFQVASRLNCSGAGEDRRDGKIPEDFPSGFSTPQLYRIRCTFLMCYSRVLGIFLLPMTADSPVR
jgi:hypothetical protein